MDEGQHSGGVASGSDADGSTGKKNISTITFPYGGLDDAIKVAHAAFELGGAPQLDQLAHKLDHKSVNSGTFVQKLGTSRIFGLIERQSGVVRLTDLGKEIVQPGSEARAKAEAFLGVPLYKVVYDQYKGNILPSDNGLENFMIQAGVSPKQADRARQAFQRSAATAGFFPDGARNKLIMPSTNGALKGDDPSDKEETDSELDRLRKEIEQLRKGSGFDMPVLPQAIVGVLYTLPLGEDEKWTPEDLTEWTQMFEVVIKRAFKDKIERVKTSVSSNEPQPPSSRSPHDAQD